jgi:hypothetical protein
MTGLDALQQENFTQNQQLAQSADAMADNAAIRKLVGCGRGISRRQPRRRVVAPGRSTCFNSEHSPDARARGMPSIDAGRTVRGGRYPHGRRYLHCGIVSRGRVLRQLCRVGHAGAVGPDRPARRLRTDGRGDS